MHLGPEGRSQWLPFHLYTIPKRRPFHRMHVYKRSKACGINGLQLGTAHVQRKQRDKTRAQVSSPLGWNIQGRITIKELLQKTKPGHTGWQGQLRWYSVCCVSMKTWVQSSECTQKANTCDSSTKAWGVKTDSGLLASQPGQIDELHVQQQILFQMMLIGINNNKTE